MKTIKQWLQELPEPYQAQALANLEWEGQDEVHPTLERALYFAFNFSRSNEGGKYWFDFINTLKNANK
jgi:hypothetical protein